MKNSMNSLLGSEDKLSFKNASRSLEGPRHVIGGQRSEKLSVICDIQTSSRSRSVGKSISSSLSASVASLECFEMSLLSS